MTEEKQDADSPGPAEAQGNPLEDTSSADADVKPASIRHPVSQGPAPEPASAHKLGLILFLLMLVGVQVYVLMTRLPGHEVPPLPPPPVATVGTSPEPVPPSPEHAVSPSSASPAAASPTTASPAAGSPSPVAGSPSPVAGSPSPVAGSPSPAAPSTPPTATPTGVVDVVLAPIPGVPADYQERREAGYKVYLARGCATCHGATGEGGKGPSLRGRYVDRDPAHVSSRIASGSDAAHHDLGTEKESVDLSVFVQLLR